MTQAKEGSVSGHRFRENGSHYNGGNWDGMLAVCDVHARLETPVQPYSSRERQLKRPYARREAEHVHLHAVLRSHEHAENTEQ